MNNPKALMVLLTLISGTISGATLLRSPILTWIGPGLFFGLATAMVLRLQLKLSLIRSLLWVIISIGSWYAAIRLYFGIANPQGVDMAYTVLLACGLLGSSLLAIGYRFITGLTNSRALALTVTTGTVAGYVMSLTLPLDNLLGFSLSFAIWQMAVGLCLAPTKKAA